MHSCIHYVILQNCMLHISQVVIRNKLFIRKTMCIQKCSIIMLNFTTARAVASIQKIVSLLMSDFIRSA